MDIRIHHIHHIHRIHRKRGNYEIHVVPWVLLSNIDIIKKILNLSGVITSGIEL
jgi:hypothetical protein